MEIKLPTYTFIDDSIKDGEEWDDFISMSEKEIYLAANPNIRQVIKPVALVGDHMMGVGPKTDGGFQENMQRISAAHPGSPLADKFGGSTETHKNIKLRSALDKMKKKKGIT